MFFFDSFCFCLWSVVCAMMRYAAMRIDVPRQLRLTMPYRSLATSRGFWAWAAHQVLINRSPNRAPRFGSPALWNVLKCSVSRCVWTTRLQESWDFTLQVIEIRSVPWAKRIGLWTFTALLLAKSNLVENKSNWKLDSNLRNWKK